MCKCRPEIKTPFCGRLGCEWPQQRVTRVFDPIHAICVSLRGKPCDLCPETEPSVYGPCKRGCRGLAEDVASIARHGNPWGPEASAENIERWRNNFNAE